MHSSRYKAPDILRDKRVLIVGAGNSGCDIAVEASRHAAKTFLSVRRGYHYLPKYIFGRPTDQVGEVSLKLRLPLVVRAALNQVLLRVLAGSPERVGLPRPDHKLFESHPIVNSHIMRAVGRGDICPKPDLQELRGREVLFRDGTMEQIDLIIYATGYRVSFPFLDRAHLNWTANWPDFYLHIFHPEYNDLFVVGMIQPDSGVWWLMDLQARAVAQYIRCVERNPPAAERFRVLTRGPRPDLGHGIRYLKTDRHHFEVEHSSYQRRLKKLIKLLGS